MSVYDKSIKSVADAAAKIMGEALKGNQHKIDVAEPKGKITGADFAKLRTMKKEETEQIDELSKKTLSSYTDKVIDKTRTMPQDAKKEKHMTGLMTAANKQLVKKEEVELQEMEEMIDALILEYESKGGVYKHKGTYGTAKGAEYGETDYAKENDMAKAADKPAKKKYGARQNYVRSTRVNESFTSLLEKYTEGGVKSLNESFYTLEESVDNAQFNAELEKSKRKNAGEDRNDKGVAAASVQSVKQVSEDAEQVEERTMTEPEMKKREEIVKSMKKGMAGFKQRYGERAKSVMYATAAKIAKEKA